MKRALVLVVLLFSALCLAAADAAQQAKSAAKTAAQPLRIYFIDVEGGAATLIATPAGESLLFDSGWPRPDARDAKRIAAAAQEFGLKRIDHLVTTHYHIDHWGAIPELLKLIPVGKFYDHGGRALELVDDKSGFPRLNAAYEEASKGQSTKLKAGDEIRLERAPGTPPLSLEILIADHEVRQVKTAKPNPQCVDLQSKPEDTTENGRSIGSLLTFGKFRFLNLADVTWNFEQKLVCPSDLIGAVSLYQVTHHMTNLSNNPAVLRTIHPQVAVSNNGPRKGGSPDTVSSIRSLPGLEDLYQLHRAMALNDEQNVPQEFIANLGQEQGCEGYGVKVEVAPDGNSYVVTNTRTGQTRKYVVKQ